MIWDALINLANKLLPSPEDKLKFEQMVRQAEADYEKALTERIAAVNATMQAEAKSEHWAQWLWRPMIGFTFSAVIINNYIVMPYFQKYLQPIVMPERIWEAMLVILGAAAFTRGWQKVEQIKANGNGKTLSLGGGVTVAHPTVNRTVEGSNPSPPARPFTSDTEFRRE